MADLNDLLVRIDGTTEQLRRELRRAETSTESTTRKMDRSLRRVDAGFERVGRMARSARVAVGALFGAVILRQATSFAQRMLRNADAIGKAAQTADQSTRAVQELRFAFGQLAGTTDRDVDLALQRFNRRLGLARDGSTEYADTFDALNVTLQNETPEALEYTLRSLARIENGSDRAALASKVFGEEAGPRLAAALDNGIEAVEQLRQQLNDSGGIITDEQIEKAEAFNDRMDAIGRQFDAQTTAKIMEHAEAFEALAEGLGAVASKGIGATAVVTDFLRALTPQTQVPGTRAAAEADPYMVGYDPNADVPVVRTGTVGLRRGRTIVTQPDVAAAPVAPAAPSRPRLPPQRRPVPTIEPSVSFETFDAEFGEIARLFESTRTETELLEQQIARVKELADGGLFEHAGIDDQEILARLQERLEGLQQETNVFAETVADAFGNQIGGAIDQMFTDGEISLENFTAAFLRDLAQILTRLLIIKPLVDSIAGGLGGSFGTFGAAKGGEFKVPGYGAAKGADFRIGGGGAPDSHFLPLRVSSGERVTVSTVAQQRRSEMPITIVDQRGANAPPVDVTRQMIEGREQIRVLVRSEMAQAVGDGSLTRGLNAAGVPLARRGRR